MHINPLFHSSVIISSRNFKDLRSVSNLVFSCMIKWFATNKLVLLDKMSVMKFITRGNHILYYVFVIKKI